MKKLSVWVIALPIIILISFFGSLFIGTDNTSNKSTSCQPQKNSLYYDMDYKFV